MCESLITLVVVTSMYFNEKTVLLAKRIEEFFSIDLKSLIFLKRRVEKLDDFEDYFLFCYFDRADVQVDSCQYL